MWTHRRTSVLLTVLLGTLLITACGGEGDSASSETGRKVTVAGDSISVGLGAALREQADDEYDVKVIGVEGSGLAREDVFDWPDRLTDLAADFPPDVLVLSLSSNDAQDLAEADGTVVATHGNDDAWDGEYTRRLAATFDVFADTDTTVLWVGHVRTEAGRTSQLNRHIHSLAVQVASTRDWVSVADLGEILGSDDAVATECLADDGLHLRTECLDRAATELLARAPISNR